MIGGSERRSFPMAPHRFGRVVVSRGAPWLAEEREDFLDGFGDGGVDDR